jgi:hypothetical protein
MRSYTPDVEKSEMQAIEQIRRFLSLKYVQIALSFTTILVIGVVIFRNFLFTNGWPAGGDALGLVSRAYIFGKDFRWLYVWRPYSFGFVEVIHGYDFFLMVLNWVCGNAITTAKIFLFLTFTVAGFSSFTLAYWYTRNSTASLAAALVYTLNQWLFSQYTEAHGDFLFSYSLGPLVFLLFFRAFETRKLKDVLFAALALGLFATGFHPESVVIYGATFPIFAILFVLMPPKNESRLKKLGDFFKVALPLAVISLALATFVLLPMAYNVTPRYYQPTYKYVLEDMYGGGVFKNLTDAFSLGAVEVWGYVNAVDVINGVALPDVPTKTLSLILFSLACLTVFIRRDKYTIFFAVSALVAVFVAKGPNPPFGYLFVWAWLNIPYFAVFRAASRWVMMACLSHAFLTATLVDMLVRYTKEKKYPIINDAFSKLGARVTKTLKTSLFEIPLKVTRDFFTKLHRILYYAGILLLIAIFLNGFLSTWYYFQKGLQVYSLPENYLEPYSWVRQQGGDFKVIGASRSPGRWMNVPSSRFDFGYVAMLTDIGWAHDIGYESSFIHDRPTMQDGGWDPNARDFVDYLRFRLVGQQKTSDFLKLVGLFGYRYLVLPAYQDADLKFFFLNQKGAANHVVYDENGSLIIENPYYTTRFFSPTNHVDILGGYGSFLDLCKLDSFVFNKTDLFFINKLDNESFTALQESASALVLANANMLDLTMLQLRDKTTLINAADFGVYSYNTSAYWVQTTSWRDIGSLVYGGKTLTTYGNVTVDIPFQTPMGGTYDLWLRVGFLSNRGNLTISIDSDPIGKIKPEADYWCGLVWVKVRSLNLEKGKHILTLQNDGTGFNDVDTIALVEPSLFQSTYDELLSSIESLPGRIVDIMGAANIFAYDLPEGWTIQLQDYENDLLKAENSLVMIQENASVTASSVQDGLMPENAVDNSLETRWASNSSQETPQWLEAEWPSSQEVAGAKIVFETAYAKDYTIQTWNGSQWVLQVNVTDNSVLSSTHMFREPVETTKLLLNVTAYGTPHHLVSVLEFEPGRFSSISARHFIPRQGRYMLALRLASGQDYGTLDLKIGNYSLSVNCSDTQERFQWYEGGPFEFERGEQNISLTPRGKMVFDELILYSLKENENGSVLCNLFGDDFYSPMISYEEVNPTAYRVHVRTQQPFFLDFSETYSPLWKARCSDGQTFKSILAYSIINSFYINKTGEFDLDVYFEGQTYADIGLKLSLSSLVAITIVLLTPKRVVNRIRNKAALWRNKLWLLRSKRR